MKIVIALLVLLILFAGAALSLPFLVDLAAYQEHYKPLIEEALNRKIQVEGIRLTIWPRIGARVRSLTVLDDPAFSRNPFASLTALDVGVKLMPLLSGKVEVEDIILRNPVISVIKNKNGVLNVSTLGPKTPASPTAVQPEPEQQAGSPLQALALLAVDLVSVDGGRMTYHDFSAAPVIEYQVQGLDLELKSVRLGQSPTVRLRAIVQPYNFPVKLDGSFGPLVEALEVKQYDMSLGLGSIGITVKGALSGGKLDATVSSALMNTADFPIRLPLIRPVQIKDLLVVANAPYPLKQGIPAMELADVSSLSLALVMGNSVLHVKGTVLDGHAKVTVTSPSVNTADLPVETGLRNPVELNNLQANADLKGQEARLANLSFQLFNGQTKAQGGLSIGSASPPFHGKMTLQGLQLAPALQAVSSDSAVSISGTAAMYLALAGRGFTMPNLTAALEGPGHMEVKEGKIEGINLMQEAVTLLKVAGLSLDAAKFTAFSTMETDFLIKQGIINVHKLLMDSHDFQATGRGTIGFDQTLNLVVNLNLSSSLSQKIAGSSPIAKLAMKDGRLRLPLLITGTARNPSYGLDMKAVSGKVQERAQQKLKDTVEGLLQGTTKPNDLKKEGEDFLKGLLEK